MKLLLVQHTAETSPGVALTWLRQQKKDYQHLRLYEGDSFPKGSLGVGIILCGGAPNVDQEEKYPWLRPEKKWIKENIQLGNKIVGLCLGGQLCAQALGAKVYPHPKGWEVGWKEVELKATPHLLGFEKNLKIHFSQHHRYVFEAPRSAEVIATNPWWSPQAFIWKNQVLAFQFHPERDLAANEISADDPDLPFEKGDVDSREQILTGGRQFSPKSVAWFEKFLDGFFN